MRYFGNNIKLILNNLVVSYTDQGPDNAPVVIFVHGFPLNKSMWDNQVKHFRENYRVISYDIRGHGNSDAGTDDFSISLFVNDLIAFMDILKVKKATLCGLSMGGYIALNAIENFPDRFDALILADTNCRADTREAREKRMSAINTILEKGVADYAGESVKKLFAVDSFNTHKAEIDSVRDMICNTQEESICCTLLALAAREETCQKLSGISVPVLLLVGEEDQITPPKAAQLMHKSIQNSTLFVIPHAAHLSNLENPDVFNEQVKQFLSTVYQTPEIVVNEGNGLVFEHLREKILMLLSIHSI